MAKLFLVAAGLLSAVARAFVPVGSVCRLPTRHHKQPVITTRQTTPSPPHSMTMMMAVPPPFGIMEQAVRVAASLPVMYALMSINEYVTHRYYQHAEFNKSPRLQAVARLALAPFGKEVPVVRGGGHVEHHAETLDDMTLKTDDKWRATTVARSLDEDPYRGTAFSWTVSALMTLQMLPTAVPALTLGLGLSLPTTLAVICASIFAHALVWNALHPNMHALPDVPVTDGAPSAFLARFRGTPYFRFLYQNHEGHHVVGGRGNYNVACPGTDHLLGTYVPEAVWRAKATSTYLSHHGEDVSVEQQIKNHVAREKFFALPRAR